MAQVSLTLLVLKTRQLGKLREFYQAIGIPLSEEQHGTGPVHYAGRVGDATLEVYPLPDGADPADSTTRLGFRVNDLDEVLHSLQAMGTRIVSPLQQSAWGYRAVVRDPDGRAVELSRGNSDD
jgi:predicted enzyme related to lactoylglutathione lyase